MDGISYFILIVLIIILILLNKNSFIKSREKKYLLVEEINMYFVEIESLKNNYISYSKYEYMKEKYNSLYKNSFLFLGNLFRKFKNSYSNLLYYIEKYNDEYIDKELKINRKYFDEMFDYKLDEDQRKAIIVDDDYNLVVAGAGSGKTSTMVGKINYLVEKKNVDPKSILAISFTNNAVNNFNEKLKYKEVKCTTFHKLGLEIISDNIKKDVADTLLDTIINKYFDKIILNNKEELMNFVQLFSLYLHTPYDNEDDSLGEMFEYEKGFDLETLKSKCISYEHPKQRLTTLNQEKVRSYEELVIANYLYVSGINYEYEKKYEYDVSEKYHRQYKPDFYLSDYNIYLEHFGINKYDRAPQYDEFEEIKYLEGIKFKRELHEEKGTTLIETYSYYFKERIIFEKMDILLKENGVIFKEVDYKKIYDAIVNGKESIELISFKQLINKFINIFKGNNYNIEKFDEFIEDAIDNSNKRDQILLSIFKKIYILYKEALTNSEQVDFNDMINLAIEKVDKDGYNGILSYVIVDEFQDISYSRYLLLKSIINKTNSKLVAVGDDWQSIFRFSGCDLDLFVNFSNYFSNPKILYIHNTHRNSQELIDIAGNFIMKNEQGQLKKELISEKHIANPINIFYYSSNINKALMDAITCLKIRGCIDIAILGRNRRDLLGLIDQEKTKIRLDNHVDLSKIFDYKIDFYTVHASKGMEFDGVIVCNMKNYITGFPNKMSDDPVLNYVTLSENDYLFEEERRLFYVALTRTKTKCCLLVPSVNKSIFIDELLENEPYNIPVIESESDERLHNPFCPICKKGKLVIRTNRTNGNQFIGCTNYPQCTFNNKHIDILSNTIICPRCGHFLVKRKGPYGEFYGCSNYPNCKQIVNIVEDNNFYRRKRY